MDAGDRRDLVDKVEAAAEDIREAAKEAADDVAGIVENAGEKRKKYYSPSEVRKRKGCIGCGGAGVLLALSIVAVSLIALL
jgi:hypothetical protein